MKDITGLRVTQVRIYGNDAIPLQRLLFPERFKELMEACGVSGSDVKEGELVLEQGVLQPDGDGEPTRIEGVRIGPRRMAAQVYGSSADADRLHELIVGVVSRYEPGFAETKPVVATDESSCVATLDFDHMKLFAPKTRRFVKSLNSELSSRNGKAGVVGFSLSFVVKYTNIGQHLMEHSASLAQKAVTIEPRVDVPLSDRRFFTQSPTRTEDHIKLVEQLERDLS